MKEGVADYLPPHMCNVCVLGLVCLALCANIPVLLVRPSMHSYWLGERGDSVGGGWESPVIITVQQDFGINCSNKKSFLLLLDKVRRGAVLYLCYDREGIIQYVGIVQGCQTLD